MSTFVLMHETVTSHDAIGNDIELMSLIISKNHDCFVYALNRYNKNVNYIDEEKLDALLLDERTIVIYHHSVFWEHGYEKIKNAKCKVIFKYHNITPEKFFEPYYEDAFLMCKKGRAQTEVMQQKMPDAYWLSDSAFNSDELTLVPSERKGICAPFNKIEEWSHTIPDEEILQELIESNDLNVMFVGRVVPNKGHLMLLDVIRTYVAFYGQKIKLRIIGKFDEGLLIYNEKVKDCLCDYGIEPLVEFIGEVNDSTLMAYYLGSDVMICCSEHEGFCVPVIEAQNFGLPVIALDSCAVPETLGNNQLLLDKNTFKFAASLKYLADNKEKAEFLAGIGKKNFESRFTFDEIKKTFQKEIERMTGEIL